MRISYFVYVLLVTFFYSSLSIYGQHKPIPQLVKKGDKYTFMVDGKPFIMMGGQVLNASAYPDQMEEIWPIIKEMNANMIQFPIYWDEIEPVEGQFKFEDLDKLILSARKVGVRVVPLWFGSFKNGWMDYVPAWVKADPVRFPHVINPHGERVRVLSPNSKTNMDADCKAFSALMKHIREIDESDRTVIMVQVQNEAGIFGSARDFSPETNKLFNSPVPNDLVKALKKSSGTWAEVFGTRADEFFSAYYLANYINEVAKAGKKEYPLPMYINVWNGGDGLGENESAMEYPGEAYPSGGPTTTMHDLYKAVAKSIDVIAIDCYWESPRKFRAVMEKFKRPDNPLFLAETGGVMAGGTFFWVIGEYEGIGFSPYGIDGGRWLVDEQRNELSANYRMCASVMDMIADLQGTDKLQVAVQEQGIDGKNLFFEKYDMAIRFGGRSSSSGNSQPSRAVGPGRVMVIELVPDEFLFIGANVTVNVRPKYGSGYTWAQYLRAENGSYENGIWKTSSVLKGEISQVGLRLPPNGGMIKAKLTRY